MFSHYIRTAIWLVIILAMESANHAFEYANKVHGGSPINRLKSGRFDWKSLIIIGVGFVVWYAFLSIALEVFYDSNDVGFALPFKILPFLIVFIIGVTKITRYTIKLKSNSFYEDNYVTYVNKVCTGITLGLAITQINLFFIGYFWNTEIFGLIAVGFISLGVSIVVMMAANVLCTFIASFTGNKDLHFTRLVEGIAHVAIAIELLSFITI